jgi:cytosine/adenosine deaminase-related metal-dependent hydrolase
MYALRVRGSALPLLLSCSLLFALGCGDDDRPPEDDGGLPDGFVPDGTIPDGGLPDGFVPPDGSVMPGELFPPPTITTCPGDALPAPAEGRCTVTAGDTGMLITGDILTPGEVFRGGQVLVGTDGLIACVGCDCTATAGASTATQVVCPDSVVSPGLINGHDHVSFAQQPPPATTSDERFEHRNDWRRGLEGHTTLGSPGGMSSTEEMLWHEIRQMMSGTTSVFGSGGPSGVLRNLDEPNRDDLPTDGATYQTFPLGDSGSGNQKRTEGCDYPGCSGPDCFDNARMQFVPHVAEGIDEAARNELRCLSAGALDVVEPASAFIHGVGALPSDIAELAASDVELIWSPRTNITLYGDTARVTEYGRLGVTIGLGTDWLQSGSMNMLRELACADYLNQAHFDGFFPDEQLWLMATRNSARALGHGDVLGVIEVGFVADLAIYDASTRRDHRAVLAAGADDVVLVVKGGLPQFGDAALVDALRTGCELIEAGVASQSCSIDRRLCLQGVLCAPSSSAPDVACTVDTLLAAGANHYALVFCEGEPMNEPTCLPARMRMSAPDASENGSNYYSGMSSATDMDGDGIDDEDDNCPAIFNPIRPLDNGMQADSDADGIGDSCDVCPLGGDDDPATCIEIDLNDRDMDGVPNDVDNCPAVPNPGQEDMDDDEKGDACDACPTVANPGAMACPALMTTVYAVRMGMHAIDTEVTVRGLVITALADNGFYAQQAVGSEDYDGVDFSGIFVFTGGAPTNALGEQVDVTGEVADFFGLAQLANPSIVIRGTPGVPAPTVVPAADIATTGARVDELESVLVRVEAVTVSEVGLAGGDFRVDGGLLIGDDLFELDPPAAVGNTFSYIQGPLNFGFMNSRIEPRSALDLGASTLRVSPGTIGLEPTETVDVTVILPDPAPAGGASVAIAVLPAGLLTGPANIVVPAGALSATATYTASASEGTGMLTASYDGDDVIVAVSVAVPPPAPPLLFTEYVEGSGTDNKAIEIGNVGTSAIDLSACVVRVYQNSAAAPTGTITLSGMLAPGGVLALCRAAIAPSCTVAPLVNHNGDDSYDIECGGVLVDRFGVPGMRPMTAWTGGGLSTADRTLRRRCDAVPSTTGFGTDPSTQYSGHPINELTGLGNRDECD